MPPQSDTALVKREVRSEAPQLFTWEEIGLHSGRGNSKQERWLVINRKVYDVSQFHLRHPGGTRVISHYAGQDATFAGAEWVATLSKRIVELGFILQFAGAEWVATLSKRIVELGFILQDAFTAFHKNEDLVKKYLSSLLIGELAPDQPNSEPSKNEMLIKDFRELHSTVKKMGLLKPRYSFFLFMFVHAFLLDVAAWVTIWYFGKSWVPFLIGSVLFTVGQIQYGFLQHDLGHYSVFPSGKFCWLANIFVSGILKGITYSWWSHMHNQHHAKPNCFRKDPDLNMHPFLFSLGKKLSVELGKKKKKYMPYQYQHAYFALFAPLVLVAFTQAIIIRFTIKRKKWLEFALILMYNVRVCLMYVPLMGFNSFMAFYWMSRFFESSWFLWISQMNHIPMNIDYDKNLDWVSGQLAATCNVDQSLFNDWYTGHLNFQIEHHLFPTMPRHNYWKVAPLVKSLCAKHGVQYQCKPLLTAFADILRTLKESGQHWQDAYHFG